jgi:hypothetical protein
MDDQGARAASGIAGFVAVLISVYGTLWVLLAMSVAAERPDPEIPDGDPCCTHPDTWSEVADGAFAALSVASIDALVFTCGLACALYARNGRWPSWRRLRWIPIGAVAAAATLMALALAWG